MNKKNDPNKILKPKRVFKIDRKLTKAQEKSKHVFTNPLGKLAETTP
jgi:hypothetical protein